MYLDCRRIHQVFQLSQKERQSHSLSLRTISLHKKMTPFSLLQEDAFYLLFDKSNVNCHEYTKMDGFYTQTA